MACLDDLPARELCEDAKFILIEVHVRYETLLRSESWGNDFLSQLVYGRAVVFSLLPQAQGGPVDVVIRDAADSEYTCRIWKSVEKESPFPLHPGVFWWRGHVHIVAVGGRAEQTLELPCLRMKTNRSMVRRPSPSFSSTSSPTNTCSLSIQGFMAAVRNTSATRSAKDLSNAE